MIDHDYQKQFRSLKTLTGPEDKSPAEMIHFKRNELGILLSKQLKQLEVQVL